jgi:hypothetical protein
VTIYNLKCNYQNNQINECKDKPKKLWETIKNIYQPASSNNHSIQLTKSGNSTQEALNSCNIRFATAGSNLADQI